MGRPHERNRRATFGVGLTLAGIYLGLAALTAAYPIYMLAYDRVHSELSGVPVIVVGMPWSLLVIESVALVRPPSGGLFALFAMTVPGVLLNAWLLYLLGRKASGHKDREPQ